MLILIENINIEWRVVRIVEVDNEDVGARLRHHTADVDCRLLKLCFEYTALQSSTLTTSSNDMTRTLSALTMSKGNVSPAIV